MSGPGGSIIEAIEVSRTSLEAQSMTPVGLALGDSAAREILAELGIVVPGRVQAAAWLTSFKGLKVMASDFGPRCALLVDVRGAK